MNIDFARAEWDRDEIEAVNKTLSEKRWLASGPENEAFEKEFAEYIGVGHAVTCNSGSGANLLSLTALRKKPGMKVMSGAAGFPATVGPILHLRFKPVLIDYRLETHNLDTLEALDKISEVDAAIVAHSLGNPVDILPLKTFVPVIEDCCEAV